jgi:hypothetical protein
MSDASIDDTVPADTLAEGEATGDARSGEAHAPDVADVADADATADDDGAEVLDGAGTGARDGDDTVSADDLTRLQEEPTPVEPTD